MILCLPLCAYERYYAAVCGSQFRYNLHVCDNCYHYQLQNKTGQITVVVNKIN